MLDVKSKSPPPLTPPPAEGNAVSSNIQHPTSNNIAPRLLRWFDQHGRKNLPWQKNITAYRVWLSETMLQQTQVATVIPYFQRFTRQFPSVKKLAEAPLDQVLHLWTGLGYYARARNLHKTAQIVANNYQGRFPQTVAELQALPGIGRSTAGAICAIAFNQWAPILDGNVKRVLARYRAVPGWPGETATARELWSYAEQYTPKNRLGDYTQAIMDLGATLCTRTKPTCAICPLSADCAARLAGNPEDFPGKKPRKSLPVKKTCFLLLQNNHGEILLEQRPPTGLWGGLWTFPECPDETDIEEYCRRYHCQPLNWSRQGASRHTFSHFHLDFTPILAQVKPLNSVAESANAMWVKPNGGEVPLGLPAPIKKLLAHY